MTGIVGRELTDTAGTLRTALVPKICYSSRLAGVVQVYPKRRDDLNGFVIPDRLVWLAFGRDPMRSKGIARHSKAPALQKPLGRAL